MPIFTALKIGVFACVSFLAIGYNALHKKAVKREEALKRDINERDMEAFRLALDEMFEGVPEEEIEAFIKQLKEVNREAWLELNQ